MDVLSENAIKAQTLIQYCVEELHIKNTPCKDGCNRSLDNAVCTDKNYRNNKIIHKLDAIAGRITNNKGWIN